MDVARKKVGYDLTVGPIFKTLLIFAFPIVLTNIVQQLYSTVDLIIIGKFVGSIGTVGVSTGGELSDLMTPVASGFATAGQIYVAQLMGAKDEEKMRESVGTLLTFMIGLSLVLMVLILIFYNSILGWLNCPAEAYGQARDYLLITAIGIPFIFGFNAISGLLRGMGESQKPLLFVVIAASVNIVADIIFVVAFRMEAAGTAIATVSSQIGCFLAALVFMNRHHEQFHFKFTFSYFRIRKEPLLIILKLGIPQLIRSFSVHFSMLWVKANVNSYGLVVSATSSIGNKLEKLMNVFVQGVDSAAGAIIGQNLGAKKHDRVRKTLLVTLACALTFGSASAALLWIVPKPLYRLFTDDPEILEFGVFYLRVLSVSFIVGAIIGPFKALVSGAGEAMLSFICGVLDGVSRIAISLLFLLIVREAVFAYFWGTALSQVVPAIICIAYFISGKWKTKKLLTER